MTSAIADNKDAESRGAAALAGRKIVAIDDDPMTLRLLQSHLEMAGYNIQTAADGTTGLGLIDDSVSVALIDLRMPDLSGFDCLRHIRQQHLQVQVIILTGSNEVGDAVEAMREGAFQFVTKPFDPKQLLVYVAKGVEAWQLADENRDLKESHSHNLPVRLGETAGDVHCRLMQQIDRIATLDSTVFIGGESGTGKSTIARMIHQQSPRADKPFVTVNCASLPRDLLQSELFGHTRGAFTGAVKDRAGHAEVADGGTLFLDEIGDLPLELQPKLLTFLQDRTVQRLGSTQTKKVDVRLIVATHRDLAQMCRENLFRHDLYFRLLVLSLELPPLRHRLGELPGIAASILSRICQRQSLPEKSFSETAMGLLLDHSWTGNIRELENVLERAVAFCDAEVIQARDLLFSEFSLDRRDASPGDAPAAPSPVRQDSVEQSSDHSHTTQDIRSEAAQAPDFLAERAYPLAGKTLEQIEREAIIQTLAACGGNKAKSARMLKISEKSIYNKMRRLGIKY